MMLIASALLTNIVGEKYAHGQETVGKFCSSTLLGIWINSDMTVLAIAVM